MRNILFVATTLMLSFSGSVFAGVSCTENVTEVILHSNSNIYFKTDKTCPSWCQIGFTDNAQKGRAYGMLLSAATTKTNMRFNWLAIDSCDQTNETYASPDYIMYTPQ